MVTWCIPRIYDPPTSAIGSRVMYTRNTLRNHDLYVYYVCTSTCPLKEHTMHRSIVRIPAIGLGGCVAVLVEVGGGVPLVSGDAERVRSPVGFTLLVWLVVLGPVERAAYIFIA